MSSKESASSGITAADVYTDFGERVRKGYDPAVVDAHLERIARGVADLQARLEDDGGDNDESLELVLRATRRSVDEALTEARVKADKIVADANAYAENTTAESDQRATASLRDAEEQASRLVTEAESRASALDAETAERRRAAEGEARDRYAEIGRLLEVREVELEALDAEIERRQESLRIASADLLRLADGFIDLRTPPPAETDDDTPADEPVSSLPAPGSTPES